MTARLTKADEADDELAGPNLPTGDAAKYLDVSASFLNKLRSTGGGPTYLKFGSRVKYPLGALQRYKQRHKRRSTSDDGGE